jgi:hypothetical protein
MCIFFINDLFCAYSEKTVFGIPRAIGQLMNQIYRRRKLSREGKQSFFPISFLPRK